MDTVTLLPAGRGAGPGSGALGLPCPGLVAASTRGSSGDGRSRWSGSASGTLSPRCVALGWGWLCPAPPSCQSQPRRVDWWALGGVGGGERLCSINKSSLSPSVPVLPAFYTPPVPPGLALPGCCLSPHRSAGLGPRVYVNTQAISQLPWMSRFSQRDVGEVRKTGFLLLQGPDVTPGPSQEHI